MAGANDQTHTDFGRIPMTRHTPIYLLCLAVLAPMADRAAAAEPLAFVGATVIDGNGGEPIENGTVVIRGETIAELGSGSAVEVPQDARVVDAAGMTVLPGLADMHVHLLGGWDGVTVDMLGYRRYLNALLYAGVTTVLDTGNVMPFVLQMRDAVAARHDPRTAHLQRRLPHRWRRPRVAAHLHRGGIRIPGSGYRRPAGRIRRGSDQGLQGAVGAHASGSRPRGVRALAAGHRRHVEPYRQLRRRRDGRHRTGAPALSGHRRRDAGGHSEQRHCGHHDPGGEGIVRVRTPRGPRLPRSSPGLGHEPAGFHGKPCATMRRANRRPTKRRGSRAGRPH